MILYAILILKYFFSKIVDVVCLQMKGYDLQNGFVALNRFQISNLITSDS